MAAAPVAQMETLLTCSICLDTFEDPRTLGCFHSFCKSCLEKFVKRQRETARTEAAAKGKDVNLEEFNCPVCTSSFCLKQGQEVDGMTPNHFVGNMLDVLEIQRQTKDIPCSLCEGSAVSRCTTCNDFLCSKCLIAHENCLKFKDHVVLTMDELTSPENQGKKARGRSYCKKHEKKSLKFYCETCQELVCRYCMDFSHAKENHSCLPAEDVAEKERVVIRLCCGILEENLKKGNEALQEISNVTQSLENNAKKAKEDIILQKETIIKTLTQKLEEKAHLMMNKVDEKRKEILIPIEKQKSEIQTYVETMKSSVDLTKNLLDEGNHEEILSSKMLIEENYGRMKKECPNGMKPVHDGVIQFKVKPINYAMVIDNLGDIEATKHSFSKQESIRFPPNSNSKVAGLELDSKCCQGDGEYHVKQLFECKRDRAHFTPISNVISNEKLGQMYLQPEGVKVPNFRGQPPSTSPFSCENIVQMESKFANVSEKAIIEEQTEIYRKVQVKAQAQKEMEDKLVNVPGKNIAKGQEDIYRKAQEETKAQKKMDIVKKQEDISRIYREETQAQKEMEDKGSIGENKGGIGRRSRSMMHNYGEFKSDNSWDIINHFREKKNMDITSSTGFRGQPPSTSPFSYDDIVQMESKFSNVSEKAIIEEQTEIYRKVQAKAQAQKEMEDKLVNVPGKNIAKGQEDIYRKAQEETKAQKEMDIVKKQEDISRKYRDETQAQKEMEDKGSIGENKGGIFRRSRSVMHNYEKKNMDITSSTEAMKRSFSKQESIPSESSNTVLDVGSMVEVLSELGCPRYGVIRWTGFPPISGRKLAGLELEEKLKACSDGTFLGKRYFTCSNERGLFVHLCNCRPDSRFGREAMKHSFSKQESIPSKSSNTVLDVGSMVEVLSELGCPRYGVIRWTGFPPISGRKFAGLELEEKLKACSDGTFLGKRYFTCSNERGLFVHLCNCRPDSRFGRDGNSMKSADKR